MFINYQELALFSQFILMKLKSDFSQYYSYFAYKFQSIVYS